MVVHLARHIVQEEVHLKVHIVPAEARAARQIGQVADPAARHNFLAEVHHIGLVEGRLVDRNLAAEGKVSPEVDTVAVAADYSLVDSLDSFVADLDCSLVVRKVAVAEAVDSLAVADMESLYEILVVYLVVLSYMQSTYVTVDRVGLGGLDCSTTCYSLSLARPAESVTQAKQAK